MEILPQINIAYAVRVDLVTSWSPGRKKREATSWLLREGQIGLSLIDKRL